MLLNYFFLVLPAHIDLILSTKIFFFFHVLLYVLFYLFLYMIFSSLFCLPGYEIRIIWLLFQSACTSQ
jgi:hypothetical protein